MLRSRFPVLHVAEALTLVLLFLGLHDEAAFAGEPGAARPTVLRAVGADSMGPLMHCWNELVASQSSGFTVEFTPELSADGAAAMIRREADLSPFARELFPSEAAAFQTAFKAQPTLIRVAGGSFAGQGKTHALAIYVHPGNPVASLSVGQLRALFAGDGTVTWGDMGLGGEWQDEPVRAYGMINLRASGNPPGIVNYMRNRINGGEPLSNAIIQLAGDDKVHALQQIVNAVDADRFAIGYSGFGFANAASKAISISESSVQSPVTASPATVESHQYPLSRYIYMAVRPDLDPDSRSAMSELLNILLTQEGQDCIRNDPTGFLPMTAATTAVERGRIQQFAASVNKPASLTAGSYWTPEGRIRVVGYNDMWPLLTAMNGLFSELHPGINFELDLKGTRTAPPALTTGHSAFAPMGAEFSEVDLEEFRQKTGSEPLAIRVAHASLHPQALSGPLAFFVHSSNPLKQISLSDAKLVFSQTEDAQAIETWGELGLGGPWADRQIEPCGLASSTALGSFLRQHKFDGQPFVAAVREFPQSRDAVEYAATHPDALCFAAHNRRTAAVKTLAVSEHNDQPAYEATPETITGGLYPLDRYLYIYVRQYNEPVIDALVSEYLRMVLSSAGQALVSSTPPGYLPLNAHETGEELAKLRELETGESSQ